VVVSVVDNDDSWSTLLPPVDDESEIAEPLSLKVSLFSSGRSVLNVGFFNKIGEAENGEDVGDDEGDNLDLPDWDDWDDWDDDWEDDDFFEAPFSFFLFFFFSFFFF